MRIFHRTTPVRIVFLIAGIFTIAKAAVTNEMLYLSAGAAFLTIREYIYNIEFYHGFLHYYNEKILKKKVEPTQESDDMQGLI